MDSSSSRKLPKNLKGTDGLKSGPKAREARPSSGTLRRTYGLKGQVGGTAAGRALVGKKLDSRNFKTAINEYLGQGGTIKIQTSDTGPTVSVEGAPKYFTSAPRPMKSQHPEVVAKPEDPLKLLDRVGAIEAVLDGENIVAHVLGVSPEKLEATVLNEGPLDIGIVRRIIDLEFVVTRASLLYSDLELVNAWMRGKNSHLQGASPLDVVGRDDLKTVIVALNQEMSGGFA